jgi:hypothetical protein
MKQHPSLQDKPLPSATTPWCHCPFLGTRLTPQHPPATPKTPPASVAHGGWQMDAKKSVIVQGVGATTFHQALDEFGRATVMHRAHPAFTQWGLPFAIKTDRATIFVDADPTPFPTRLTLWWVGLGIQHHLIPRHTHQRNGSVERSHRTLDERTLIGQQFNEVNDLQQRVVADWSELNKDCPSRARGCNGQPPLVAHPELLGPRRSYRSEQKLKRFEMARVDAYLAKKTWIRTVSQVGQVILGNHRYGLGVVWVGQTVSIRFEAQQRQFIFVQVKPHNQRGCNQPELDPIGLDAQGLTVEMLTPRPENSYVA